jgi:hypothetical protein
LIAALLNVTCPAAPGVRDSVCGAVVSVKSGLPGGFVVAVTVSATVAFVLRSPDAPYTFTFVVPITAFAAAVSVNVVLEPTVTVAVAGVTVTPVGSPVTET